MGRLRIPTCSSHPFLSFPPEPLSPVGSNPFHPPHPFDPYSLSNQLGRIGDRFSGEGGVPRGAPHLRSRTRIAVRAWGSRSGHHFALDAAVFAIARSHCFIVSIESAGRLSAIVSRLA